MILEEYSNGQIYGQQIHPLHWKPESKMTSDFSILFPSPTLNFHNINKSSIKKLPIPFKIYCKTCVTMVVVPQLQVTELWKMQKRTSKLNKDLENFKSDE